MNLHVSMYLHILSYTCIVYCISFKGIKELHKKEQQKEYPTVNQRSNKG